VASTDKLYQKSKLLKKQYLHLFKCVSPNAIGYMCLDYSGSYSLLQTDLQLLGKFIEYPMSEMDFNHRMFAINNQYYNCITEFETVKKNPFISIPMQKGYRYIFHIKKYVAGMLHMVTLFFKDDPMMCKDDVLLNLEAVKTQANLLINNLAFIVNQDKYRLNHLKISVAKDSMIQCQHDNLSLSFTDKDKSLRKETFDYDSLPFSMNEFDFDPNLKEIIFLLYCCKSHQDIADFLDISIRTLTRKLKDICNCLYCKSFGHIIPTLMRENPSQKMQQKLKYFMS
jgi:hypothetical protein